MCSWIRTLPGGSTLSVGVFDREGFGDGEGFGAGEGGWDVR